MINAVQEQVPQSALSPYINVSFSLAGKQLPADHGYLVYSAISRSTSSLHGIDWLAIELISGFPSGRGVIDLPGRVLPLAGKRLDVGGHQIRLGLPVARPLEPAPSLYARVVTIKKFTEAEPFIEAVKRKLDSFGVRGRVELPREEVRAGAGGERGRYRRRIITIHGKSVVGFSVAIFRVLVDKFIQRLSASLISLLSDHWQAKIPAPVINALRRSEADRNRRRVGVGGKRCTAPDRASFTHLGLLVEKRTIGLTQIPIPTFDMTTVPLLTSPA